MSDLGYEARVAVLGAGPGGLAAAKHALEAGFDVSVFEASDDLGGQGYTTAAHSGIWPGMRTNTSRTMTAFSDYPAPVEGDLHPGAEQIHDYPRSYADEFGVTSRIRFDTTVRSVRSVRSARSPRSGWEVDGKSFDAVILASGRFHSPVLPTGRAGFTGEVMHAYDYPGAEHLRGRRVVVYGNGSCRQAGSSVSGPARSRHRTTRLHASARPRLHPRSTRTTFSR